LVRDTIKIKESDKHHYGALIRHLLKTDSEGKQGIDYLEKEGIEIVNLDAKADLGISKHGDKVKGVPKDKCILWKGEPPIYFALWGRKLSNPRYMKKFFAVMSTSIEKHLNQYHFVVPQEFIHKKYFDNEKNKFLCMMLKNKKRNLKANYLFPNLVKYNKKSLLEFREEYDKEFCKQLSNQYDSYGRGWCEDCFKGKAPDKFKTIAEYKFNFCPENSRFNGYVTEKIIDAMTCGNIPIYLGAPDIKEYIPENCFIDASDFKSKSNLITFIKYFDSLEYNAYRKAIKEFINTDKSKYFSSVTFAKTLIKIIEENW